MSYGVALVINKADIDKEKIPYIVIGGFDGMHWFMNKDNKKALGKINAQVYKYLTDEPDGYTSVEKLKTAPVDTITMIICDDDGFEMMEHTPLDNSKNVVPDLKVYLDIC